MTSNPPSGEDGVRPLDALRTDVADAVADLDGLTDRPVAEHVAAYERLHTVLGEALSAGPDRT